MAKLSARGRYEVLRLEKTVSLSGDQLAGAQSYDAVQTTVRFAFMSDNHYLVQQISVWKDGMKHNYGWKDKGKYGLGAINGTLEEIKTRLISKGYIEVKKGN